MIEGQVLVGRDRHPIDQQTKVGLALFDHITDWEELKMTMGLAGSTVLPRVEESKQSLVGRSVTVLIPRAKAGMCQAEVIYLEDPSLRFILSGGNDKMVSDHREFVQHQRVGCCTGRYGGDEEF